MELLSRREGPNSYLVSVIREGCLLIALFDYVHLSFIRSRGNMVADFLARNASSFPDSFWIEEVPLAVVSLVNSYLFASMLSS